jgi:glycosyltransferase involved in cell wall biosynthesis
VNISALEKLTMSKGKRNNMKATIYMATYNKNECLSNTLYSIARQKVPFPYEVCVIDDHSEVDPEPIIRKFIPDAKYKRFNRQQGFDVVTMHALSLASDDSDILIMQSSDVIHGNDNTIQQLCEGVSNRTCCMAAVHNTNPPLDMHKDFDNHLPTVLKQWDKGKPRSGPGGGPLYFFLGAMRREDYERLGCVKAPHCDNILRNEIVRHRYGVHYPPGLKGFHQDHPTTTVPCMRLMACGLQCPLKNRCVERGWQTFEEYLEWKEKN